MPRWRLNVRRDIFVRWQKLQGALVWRYLSCDPGLVAVWVGACRRPADILYLSISFRYETSARKPQERIGLLAGVQFPAHVADLPTLNASKCRTPIVGVIL